MVTPFEAAWERPRAVLFDLDGTLYDQRPLRKAMLKELALAPLRQGPLRALRIAKVLKSFRVLREDLRALGHGEAPLALLQYEGPAEATRLDPARVQATVEEWMHEKPLPHLGAAAWPGLRETLVRLREGGVKLGVFSDYPPAAKLDALGVGDLFEVKLGATDAAVNAFKPHPRGFEEGARQLGEAIEQVVYVGDRHDVDAAGCAAAGMRCVILETGMSHVAGSSGSSSHGSGEDRANGSAASSNPAVRSIFDFSEVPHAVGI